MTQIKKIRFDMSMSVSNCEGKIGNGIFGFKFRFLDICVDDFFFAISILIRGSKINFHFSFQWNWSGMFNQKFSISFHYFNYILRKEFYGCL